jgi:hypothetical protein
VKKCGVWFVSEADGSCRNGLLVGLSFSLVNISRDV